MTLNTVDDTKIKLLVYLFMYFYKFCCVPLTDLLANPVANEESTQIGPLWLPLAVYKNIIQLNNNQA